LIIAGLIYNNYSIKEISSLIVYVTFSIILASNCIAFLIKTLSYNKEFYNKEFKAYQKEFPSFLIASKTTSLSFLSSFETKLKELPLYFTAFKHISLSFFKAFEAYRKEFPLFLTASYTTSLSF
jgi:hypothetical protein